MYVPTNKYLVRIPEENPNKFSQWKSDGVHVHVIFIVRIYFLHGMHVKNKKKQSRD